MNTSLFTIEAKKRAVKFVETLDSPRKERIRATVQILKQNPVPIGQVDLAKLKDYNNLYRIRIGNIRIVYEVFWSERRILLHYIGTRGKAYTNL